MNIRSSSALRTGYAEKKEVQPKVALVDNFRNADTSLAHGEITDSVLTIHGQLEDSDVQRLHGETAPPFHPTEVYEAPAEEILGKYTNFVTGAATSFLDMTSDNIELVLNEMPSVKVISQSQSQTPTRLVQTFLDPLQNDADFRSRIAKGLGLESDSLGQVLSSLTQHTETALRQSELVQDASKRYEQLAEQAYDAGVSNIIAGGNQGELAEQFKAYGAETSPSAFRSILVNDHVTVVGASTKDGQVASLNSPNAGVEVYALGEAVPFKADGQVQYANGTSVSTPLVAGQAVKVLNSNPDFSVFQVENALIGQEGYRVGQGESASVVSADQELHGDGDLDPWFVESFGGGVLKGLSDPDIPQFIQSQNNVRVGIPGQTEDVFQVVTARNSEGGRTFQLDTYSGTEQHVVKARFENGLLVQDSVVEEYFKPLEK